MVRTWKRINSWDKNGGAQKSRKFPTHMSKLLDQPFVIKLHSPSNTRVPFPLLISMSCIIVLNEWFHPISNIRVIRFEIAPWTWGSPSLLFCFVLFFNMYLHSMCIIMEVIIHDSKILKDPWMIINCNLPNANTTWLFITPMILVSPPRYFTKDKQVWPKC